MAQRTAVIAGAGPAGLTAALELAERADVKPIIFEMTDEIGGISRTVDLHGSKIDIGGHRFYSESPRVIDWWQRILPVQGSPSRDDITRHREVPFSDDPGAPDPEAEDDVLLVRRRLSRILFLRKFFDYPISLNRDTLVNLGLRRVGRMGLSYLRSRLAPIKPEKSLEDFLTNSFGRELYETFFRDYTQKVWGVPCSAIDPEWGPQQIQGISIRKALFHALERAVRLGRSTEDEETDINLAVRFLYPKYGPGQLWERAAQMVQDRGGELHLKHRVVGFDQSDGQITGAVVQDVRTGETRTVGGDFFISTMPIADLVDGLADVPEDVREVARGLVYRGFISVELLFRNVTIGNRPVVAPGGSGIPDNWIYVQEPNVELGRIQVLNNWSPYLVKDPDTAFIGLEYFANEGDDLWSKSDDDMVEFALDELDRIGIVIDELLDSMVLRESVAYPVYRGTYDRMHVVRDYVDRFGNLFLLGRAGTHTYDSTDIYMLSAMEAVDNIIAGKLTKDNVWGVRR